MDPTVRHFWRKLLYPAVAIVVVGAIAYVVSTGWKTGASAPQATGNEGGTISMSLPQGTSPRTPVTATFVDPGEHGFVSMKSGGGIYMKYDPNTNLEYKASATMDAGGVQVTIPDGICGYIVKSDLEPNPPPKYVYMSVKDADGKVVPGMEKVQVAVKCDTYTLAVKIQTSKDPVLPDGADQATVTANLSVTGPAQYVNGQKVKPGAQKITLTTPLGLIDVEFTTDLGTLNPASPAKVRTDLAGNASVTITSTDAGIASVRAVALSVGDAKQQIHFKPKITAVKMDFVEPNSPTNYQLQTIPANAKDLDFTWSFQYAGPPCGQLTGPNKGKNILKNAFYHGPANGFAQGCPVPNEMASHVTVTVTDKDGQTDTKTFGARAFEGQGFVNLK